jgi:cell division protein FtsI/penicillin-binding protein 2
VLKPLIIGSLLMLCCTLAGGKAVEQGADLHQQTAATVLNGFKDTDVSFILLNSSGNVLAQRWENADRPIPIGSLVKPFLAVAYRQGHQTFPSFTCKGQKTCWYPHGHGKISMREAIAFSCNSYFHQLDQTNDQATVAAILTHYGLGPQKDGYSGTASPLALAHAFVELISHRSQPELAPLYEGMAMSFSRGTATAASKAMPSYLSALAKTGTAPCTHGRRFLADGFTILLFPADQPKMVLLVREHGHQGSHAAAVAGKMVSAIEGTGQAR